MPSKCPNMLIIRGNNTSETTSSKNCHIQVIKSSNMSQIPTNLNFKKFQICQIFYTNCATTIYTPCKNVNKDCSYK